MYTIEIRNISSMAEAIRHEFAIHIMSFTRAHRGLVLSGQIRYGYSIKKTIITIIIIIIWPRSSNHRPHAQKLYAQGVTTKSQMITKPFWKTNGKARHSFFCPVIACLGIFQQEVTDSSDKQNWATITWLRVNIICRYSLTLSSWASTQNLIY